MRNKIDFGIDLGTTNSAIACMQNGTPKIFKADDQKDITPSCVSFNRMGAVLVGQTAVNTGNNEAVYALRSFKEGNSNTFKEFKRTMGTSVLYKSSHLNKELSSKELSAEVLKKLKTLVEENISSVVITIPAKFSNQQCEDTMQAAKLAGFKQVRLLQEPVAAATAYGLDANTQRGYWLVFDFGGGTFDAALVKAEEGILVVKDTEGDNWLGGKNLDEKITETFLLPYLKEHYDIQFILDDSNKRSILSNALKRYAEEVKNQLSFKNDYSLVTNLGDLPFEDGNGEEPEIDLKITTDQLEEAIKPLFQKAIDITLGLLKRNNLTGADLDKLILVGGPTFSPILRKMLKEQVTPNVDTSVDPMTVVARGAALFASSIDVEDTLKNETRDHSKLQLDIKYEGTSVEETELVSIKVIPSNNTDLTDLSAEISRGDGAWSSNRFKLTEKAKLQEVTLEPKKANIFNVVVYDSHSNRIECEPNTFTILHGMSGLDSMQVLPYHIGIIKYFSDEEKEGFFPINGLSKNTRYPAVGICDELKISQAIKAASTDSLLIPIYQGDYNAEGSDARLNNHIFDLKITGNDIPENLHENSPVRLTIKVNESSLMTVTIDFPEINFSIEKEIQIRPIEPLSIEDLNKDLGEAQKTAKKLELGENVTKLEQLQQELDNNGNNPDTRLRIQNEWRKELQDISAKRDEAEWPKLEKDIKEKFFLVDDLVNNLKKNPQLAEENNLSADHLFAAKEEIKQKLDKAIEKKDRLAIKQLGSELFAIQMVLVVAMSGGAVFVDVVRSWDRDFNKINWTNPTKARELINKALVCISNGNTQALNSLCFEIRDLMPQKDRPNLLR